MTQRGHIVQRISTDAGVLHGGRSTDGDAAGRTPRVDGSTPSGASRSGATYLVMGVAVAVLSSTALSLPRLLMTEATGSVVQPPHEEGNVQFLARAALTNPGQLTDDQYLRAMEYIEREHEQRRALRRVPSATTTSRDAHRAWRHQVELREEALKDVGSPPEGSVHWHLQQDLEQLRADEPAR